MQATHAPTQAIHRRAVLAGAAALAAQLAGCGGMDEAPDATYTMLDGSRQRTADWRGKVTLLNFWATSCTTCVAEMPQLAATFEKFRHRGFQALAVAMSYDPPAYVVNFAQSRRLPFGVAIDNTGAVARAWGGVQLTPTTFVIDRQGRIAKRFIGVPDFDALHALIDRLLA